MIETWFSTEERIAALQTRAEEWVGTPFRPNSCQHGPRGGVSCQKLCAAIYGECGWVAVEVPAVAMSHARFSREHSLAEEWLDKCPHVGRLSSRSARDVLAGDLLGFRLGRVVHHLGVALGGGAFVHAMEHLGTSISTLEDATYLSRLAVIWRPRP